jgi:NADH:ubiquinone oxidoreductase subunit 2 (subunit N)
MVITRNSWIAIWVGLEVNTLAFCSLYFIKKLYRKINLENNLKYFIIQSAASAILILFMRVSIDNPSKNILIMGGTISVLIKLAARPFHRWFIEIIKNTSTSNGCLLLTWQKLAPTFILIFLMKTLILIRLVVRAVSGVISQINQKKLNEILAISSVFNVRWTLLAVLIGVKILLQFLILYWFSVLIIIYVIWKTRFKEKSNDNSEIEINLTTTILLANLAGIPPTSGFLAKWMVITQSLTQKIVSLTSSILVIRSVNLYIYIRTFTPIIVKSFKKSQKEKASLSKSIGTLRLILPRILVILSLDHAWT